MDPGKLQSFVDRLRYDLMPSLTPGLRPPERSLPGTPEFAAEEVDLDLIRFRLEHCKDSDAVDVIMAMKFQFYSKRFHYMTRNWLESTFAEPAAGENSEHRAA